MTKIIAHTSHLNYWRLVKLFYAGRRLFQKIVLLLFSIFSLETPIMKKLILFTTLGLAFACSQTSINYVARVKPLRLFDTEIYKADKVEDVLFDSEEQNIDSLRNLSRQLFLKGVDAFRNKKAPGTAIKIFKQSILALPDAKTYYELGNALLESGMFKDEFEEAEQAFEIAERLNFQPLYLVHYKTPVP